METAQNEQKNGVANPVTITRLKMAMQVAAGVNLSEVDLPTEVSRMEQISGMVNGGINIPPTPPAAPTGPGAFPPMSAPQETPMV